jgi:methylthioribose-1-phosphate isomerase
MTTVQTPQHISLDSRVKTLEFTSEGVVQMLDQTVLPHQVAYHRIETVETMANAISTMIVRGAPAIGIAGAFGVVLSARQHASLAQTDWSAYRAQLLADIERLRQTRPTAVNLDWALNRQQALITGWQGETATAASLIEALRQQAQTILEEDIAGNQQMGAFGATLVPKGARILTHCNAGALATGGYGTALGVVRSAFAQDPTIEVFADETRPRLQGARLTTWELIEDGIPVTLVTDGMSGSLMQAGKVDLVIVGADRIAANGDTANKIGTYNLALVAHAHGVPFYVAAPRSTIDRSIDSGAQIPIEERDPVEIFDIHNTAICPPAATRYYNPSFDVTPARYIAAIITEAGIARPDYRQSLASLF